MNVKMGENEIKFPENQKLSVLEDVRHSLTEDRNWVNRKEKRMERMRGESQSFSQATKKKSNLPLAMMTRIQIILRKMPRNLLERKGMLILLRIHMIQMMIYLTSIITFVQVQEMVSLNVKLQKLYSILNITCQMSSLMEQ